MRPIIVLWRVMKAACSLSGRRRRDRYEVLLMERKEHCQIKDGIMEFATQYLKGSTPGDCVGRTQMQDALYRPEDSSARFQHALRALIRGRFLKVVPSKHIEPIFQLTGKRYFSKTAPLTAELRRLGVYSRAVQEHKPYYTPPSYKM